MNNWAKIGLGIGALWLAYKVAARGLVVGVSKVLLKGIDLSQGVAQVQLNVSVRNPLPFGVKVKDLTGDVYAQGVRIGYVNTVFDYLLGAERVHTLPVIVNLTAQGMGEALWKNIQTGDINTLILDFNGNLHVTNAGIAVPVDLSFNWKDLVG